MGGNSFGTVFRAATWGESHGPGVGAVVDGCPAGLPLSAEVIQRQLDRRRPGQSALTSPRREPDQVEILSGVYDGRTTGTPIALLVRNRDADSSQYSALEYVYRPGHADFTYAAKYGIRDFRGGGRASARETVGRVAAGAVALQLLWSSGIDVLAFTAQVGPVAGEVVDREEIDRNPVRAADPDAAPLMAREIDRARAGGDSVGGIVEARAIGVPAGLGEPVFDKLDADVAKAMMSIGAVKGVEIGAGFALARMAGSEANDPFEMVDGRVRTTTNNAGGILGGISNGEEIVVRLAVKPTSSIRQQQRTVTEDGQETTIEIHGRHDPCICPRIVPVAEAMLALVLADHLLRHRASRA